MWIWRTLAVATVVATCLPCSQAQAVRPCEARTVSSGDEGVCVLRFDGRVSCWGDVPSFPTLSSVPAGLYSQISVGYSLACGLHPDGTASCWGSPPYLAPIGRFRQISVRGNQICAVRTNGIVTCNAGSYIYSFESEEPFLDVAAGSAHACGRRQDRTVECWGENPYFDSPPPGPFAQLSASDDGVTCGLRDNGNIECWGRVYGSDFVPPSGTFTQLSLSDDVSDFGASALRQDGAWVSWTGQPLPRTDTLAGPFRDVSSGRTPVAIRSDGSLEYVLRHTDIANQPLIGTFTQVAAGGQSTPVVCGLDATGSVSCTGGNLYGEATAPPGTFMQISAGERSTCGIRTDRSIACWGSLLLAPPGEFEHLSLGQVHACGLRSDGRTLCWDRQGVLNTPAQAYVHVAAGGSHACALKATGNAECWEYDDTVENFAPAEGPFVQLSAAGYRYSGVGPRSVTCGLRLDGTIVCWGDSDDVNLEVPPGTFTQVAVGSFGACGLRPGGGVECWGDPSDWLAPPEVKFEQVAVSDLVGCGMTAEGDIHCWSRRSKYLSFCDPSTLCGNATIDDDEDCDSGEAAAPFGTACTPACVSVPCGHPVHPFAAEPSAGDALFTLHSAVGSEFCELAVCDVNNSLNVTVLDALTILRRAVGLLATFSCPE